HPLNIAAGDFGKAAAIEDIKDPILPPHRARRMKTLQRLVGVDERHAERVGEVLLRERKLDRVSVCQPDLPGAYVEVQQDVGGPFERGALAERDKMLVDQLLF